MKTKETWSKRNLNHIVLSNNAAEHYDSDYAENNYQTRLYMKYEEEVLKFAVELVTNTTLAIDLGCGTGRDLFKYASSFETAIGWDFSPKMVEITRNKAKMLGYNNVITEIRDVEKAGFDGIEDGTVGFINAGFGMGSFIEDLPAFLCKVHQALSKDGIFMVTFYNKNSVAQYVNPPCFAAIPNIKDKSLTVTDEGSEYIIPCMSYSVEELKQIFLPNFKVIKAYTYPTISTLLSNNCITVPEIVKVVKELEENVKECLWGHYIIIICKNN